MIPHKFRHMTQNWILVIYTSKFLKYVMVSHFREREREIYIYIYIYDLEFN